jgi:hypothetical protein
LTNDSSPEEACLQIEIQEDCVVSRIMRNEGDIVERGGSSHGNSA